MPTPFLPNLFLLGAAKCGTTTLWAYLDRLPDVCMSNPKEPLYFAAEYERGLGFYREAYFSHWRGEPVIGDASHFNLYAPFAARRVHATSPQARLLVVLRNPVHRAHSAWYNRHWRGKEPRGFGEVLKAAQAQIDADAGVTEDEEALRWADEQHRGDARLKRWPKGCLVAGHYMDQIERYLALYPRQNLHAILFDDLIAQPLEVMANVVRFLGLDERSNRITEPIWKNATRVGPDPGRWRRVTRKLARAARFWRSEPPRDSATRSSRPQIDSETRSWLVRYYQPHNARLSAFLGRDLSHWI